MVMIADCTLFCFFLVCLVLLCFVGVESSGRFWFGDVSA